MRDKLLSWACWSDIPGVYGGSPDPPFPSSDEIPEQGVFLWEAVRRSPSCVSAGENALWNRRGPGHSPPRSVTHRVDFFPMYRYVIPMAYSLKQAGEATGRSKPSILCAVQTGKISAKKNELGEWEIDSR